MGMLIAIHAPTGNAKITIEGDAEFGSSTGYPTSFPPSTVKAWSKAQIWIENASDHMAIKNDFRPARLSSFTIKLSCSAGASMWFRFDGDTREYSCPPNANRSYSFFGLIGDAVTEDQAKLDELCALVRDAECNKDAT